VVAAKWSNWAPWDVWSPKDAAAQAQKQPAAPRAVPVEVVTAVKKKVPVRVDLLGTVTPIASVAVKTRVDTQVKVARVMDSQSILESGELVSPRVKSKSSTGRGLPRARQRQGS